MRARTFSIALLVLIAAPLAAAISPSSSGATSDTTSQSQPEPPITEARVTTVIENHPGWVGGVTVDQLGYVYIADFREHVWRFDPVSEEIDVFASNLYGASGNTFDRNGNLYQANFYGHSVVRIARDGTMTTVADHDLAGPVGMRFDAQDNLLMCNCNDQTLKKMSPTGEITTLATSGEFNCPNGITTDPAGDIFVVSFSSPKILRVSPEGETSVFADTGGKGVGHILYLRGFFLATSFFDNKIYRITPEGKVLHFAGNGEREVRDGPVTEAAFSNPNGIAVDPTGTYVYINDYVGDPNAPLPLGSTPFSLRRIELPRLGKIVAHELEVGSLQTAEAAYLDYRSDPANAGESTENEIGALGISFFRKGDHDTAIFLFKLNADAYPDSFLAWNNLGAAYMEAGDKARAIEALERSLVLNPDNARAKMRLEKLQEEG